MQQAPLSCVLFVCIPRLGKNPPGTGAEAEGQTRSSRKHGAEFPGGFLSGANQTSSGAWGAAWLQRKHRPNAAFPDTLLLAPAIARHEDRSLGTKEGTTSPSQGSNPHRCSAPSPLRPWCPVRGDRRFPRPSFPPRSVRVVAESVHRGRAGDVKQCLTRPDSSSGLESHTLSILRHLMTNNAGQRVFLQYQEPTREQELAQGCHCAPHQGVRSPQALPWKKQTLPMSPNAACQRGDATMPRALQVPICLQPTEAPRTRGSSAQEGSTALGLEPQLPGRLVGANLGGDSAASGNGSDGKKPRCQKHQDTKGWWSGSGGRAGCQRAEKNRLDGAVGTRRRRRVPRDRGGGHCGVSQAPSPPALHPPGL